MSIDSTLSRRMTMANQAPSENKFVPAHLPWLVATGAFLLYVLTLNHWVSFGSLAYVARASGWLDWQPEATSPLFWLVTYPFHWLPLRAIPVALNLFASVNAALAIGLLARSVALLPHDRTEPERLRESSPFSLLTLSTAWLPPLVAALVCGLQLTFWEHATAASAEIFDLLLFAYIVRCLLEFRLDARDSWLLRAGFVYAAAIPNNWAMLGYLPLFLAALIWLKGITFFNSRFLGRMSLLAFLGLLLYLLLPLVNAGSGTQLGFWPTLKTSLGAQKFYLSHLVFSKYMLLKADPPLWVLGLASLLPILLISIRWPAQFGGDVSKIGIAFDTFVLHFIYGVMLLLCCWVALDPEHFGPRHLLPQIPMLTFYYLGALSIGYLIGYFLLVFGAKPFRRPRPVPGMQTLLNNAILGVLGVLVLVVPALLLYRNLPQIRTTNGPALRQYADLLAADLPPKGAIALSDDGARLFLLKSALTQSRRDQPYLLLESEWLQLPAYQRFLVRRFPGRWPSEPSKERTQRFEGLELAQIMSDLARSNALYYLHPSFGYYFEAFYPKSHGLVLELTPYATNSLMAPGPSPGELSANEIFWDRVASSALQPLLTWLPSASVSGPLDPLTRRLKLGREPNPTIAHLASFYSRSLDYWGVQLQRSGSNFLAQAAARFELALALNPDNIAVMANLDCNRDLHAGRQPSVQVSRSIQDQSGKYRDWNEAMNINGPFDQPSFCYGQAMAFAYPNGPRLVPQYHQAAQLFNRVTQLLPNDLDSRLHLAEVCVYGQSPDLALQIAADIRARATSLNLSRTNQPWLLAIETAAHLSKTDVAGAESVVHHILAQFPDNHEDLLAAASRMFITFRCYSNALEIIDQQLQIHPDDPNALYGKGLAALQLKSYDHAVGALSRVLDLQTNRTEQLHVAALLYRAEAFLNSDRLDEAQRDYEALQKDIPTAFSLYKQLAEIAYRKQDTNNAIRNYRLYLSNLPTNSIDESTKINARLKELRPGSN
jgi:tetratricopeptide (TPR) repeat protein